MTIDVPCLHTGNAPDDLLQLVHLVRYLKIPSKTDHLAKIRIFIYIRLHRRNDVIALAIGQNIFPSLMYAPHQRSLEDHAETCCLLCRTAAHHASFDHALRQFHPQPCVRTRHFHQFADEAHTFCIEPDQVGGSLTAKVHCPWHIRRDLSLAEKYPCPDCPSLVGHR